MGDSREDKKKRVANFSCSDRSLLLKIANTFNSIIESKKTDSTTWREKMEAWKKIELKFNSSSTGAPRTHKQLKNKYETIKKELRKRHSQHMSYLKGTGGGPYKSPPPPPNEEEKVLAETIALSIQGLSNRYDCDGLAGTSGITLPSSISTMDNDDLLIEYVDADWTQPHAKLLQTEIHPVLSTNSNIEFIGDSALDQILIDEDDLTNDHIYHKLEKNEISTYSQSTSQVQEKLIATPSSTNNEILKGTNQSGSWQCRRRPIIPKKNVIHQCLQNLKLWLRKNVSFWKSKKKLQQKRRNTTG